VIAAIARARGWLDFILSGKAASFDDIAAAENLADRHVRFLMPLAFLSPRASLVRPSMA
jgi:site-specific DNA recombinase